MWIETPTHLQRIKHPDLSEAVDVSGDGATQVTQEVGEVLIANYDAITEHNNE